jgi:hypothetical protein
MTMFKTVDIQTLETITGGNTAPNPLDPSMITGLPTATELGRRAGELGADLGRRAGSAFQQLKQYIPSPTFPVPTLPKWLGGR